MTCHALEKKIEAAPLKLKDALDFAIQTAKGLQAAHGKKIVHRDIKPANLMIGEDGHVTIMDFGLALLADRSKLTRLDETMGTVTYMSPEQTYGMDLDHRTDVWSLGVVIYEMVTGQRPFKGHYDQAVTYSITSEEPEPMTALRCCTGPGPTPRSQRILRRQRSLPILSQRSRARLKFRSSGDLAQESTF